MVVSTLYVQNRLAPPNKIKVFRVYEPLPPFSLAWATKILRRKPGQGRALKPVKFSLDGISVSKIESVITKERGRFFHNPLYTPLTILAGTPTAVQFRGTSVSTTAPAPIFEFRPIVIFPNIIALAPI